MLPDPDFPDFKMIEDADETDDESSVVTVVEAEATAARAIKGKSITRVPQFDRGISPRFPPFRRHCPSVHGRRYGCYLVHQTQRLQVTEGPTSCSLSLQSAEETKDSVAGGE